MKKSHGYITSLTISFVVMLGMASLIKAQDSSANIEPPSNVVKNMGFEDSTLTPWEWYVAGNAEAEGAIDEKESHGGKHSFRMSNKSSEVPNVYGALRQYIKDLQPNTTYEISMWIKGKGVQGGLICLGPEWRIVFPLPKGDYDWQHFTAKFTTLTAVDKYDLVIVAPNVIDGLWIDDVEITKFDGEKKNQSTRLYDPTMQKDLVAAARFYPVLPNAGKDPATLPKVEIRSKTSPSFGADFQAACDKQKFFF